MRLPRHDTPQRLSAEPPLEAIGHDEALLDEPAAPQTRMQMHWWLPSSPAIVVGLGLRHRIHSVIDVDRTRAAGVTVLDRKAGGGAVYLDRANMLCGALAVPTASVPADVTESYRWLGDTLLEALRYLGVAAERVSTEDARANVARLRAARSPLLSTCYGALSPHELTVEGKKLVGLAQVRRRETTLYVLGILLRDQSPLAEYLVGDDDTLRAELARRTVGLSSLTSRSAFEVVEAVADAMPSVR